MPRKSKIQERIESKLTELGKQRKIIADEIELEQKQIEAIDSEVETLMNLLGDNPIKYDVQEHEIKDIEPVEEQMRKDEEVNEQARLQDEDEYFKSGRFNPDVFITKEEEDSET